MKNIKMELNSCFIDEVRYVEFVDLHECDWSMPYFAPDGKINRHCEIEGCTAFQIRVEHKDYDSGVWIKSSKTKH